jgi:hypothetical protein
MISAIDLASMRESMVLNRATDIKAFCVCSEQALTPALQGAS